MFFAEKYFENYSQIIMTKSEISERTVTEIMLATALIIQKENEMKFGHSNVKLENLENLRTHRRMHQNGLNSKVAGTPDSINEELVKTEISSYKTSQKNTVSRVTSFESTLSNGFINQDFQDFPNQYQKSFIPMYAPIKYNWFDESASIFASIENYGMSSSFLKNPSDSNQSISWMCDILQESLTAPAQGKSLSDVYADVMKDQENKGGKSLKAKEEVEKVRSVNCEFYLTLFKFYAEILMALLNNTDRVIRNESTGMVTEDEATSAKEFTIKMIIQKYRIG